MAPPARTPRRRPDFGGPGRKFAPRRKVCGYCVDKLDEVDYKDIGRLRRYLSDRGKIEPRRKTGTCARHQRSLNLALKRARQLALLPYTAEHIRITGILIREPRPDMRLQRPRPSAEPGSEDGASPETAAVESEVAPDVASNGEAATAGRSEAVSPPANGATVSEPEAATEAEAAPEPEAATEPKAAEAKTASA